MASNAENVSIWWRHHAIPTDALALLGTRAISRLSDDHVQVPYVCVMYKHKIKYIVNRGHFKYNETSYIRKATKPRDVCVKNHPIALKFDWGLGSSADVPIKFQSDTFIQITNLVVSRLREILRILKRIPGVWSYVVAVMNEVDWYERSPFKNLWINIADHGRMTYDTGTCHEVFDSCKNLP